MLRDFLFFPILLQDKTNCPHSSYAFAAAGAIEAQYANVTKKKIVPLSPQNIMDCSSSYGNRFFFYIEQLRNVSKIFEQTLKYRIFSKVNIECNTNIDRLAVLTIEATHVGDAF